MHPVNLAGIDLNLLIALSALLQEPNVTRAARKIGLSQPAMSHALNRLRELLGDPLLVRSGRTMVLTPRAQALSPRVNTVMEGLSGVFTPEEPFQPAITCREFKLSATDYAQLTLLPALQATLRREAPFLSLDVLAITSHTNERVRAGDIDLAVGVFAPTEQSSDLRQIELYRDDFVGLARKGHPLAHGQVDLPTYVALSHILISPRGKPGGLVDNELAKKGLVRRVAQKVPHFLVVPHLVASSDDVVTMPRRVAQTFLPMMPLATFGLPIELEPTRIAMMWHLRTEEDAAHQWLRRAIVRALRTVLAHDA